MISDYCVVRRTDLPLLPCTREDCDWYVHEQDFNNCFFVLKRALGIYNKEFTTRQIARLEGISEEEVEEILESAVANFRANLKGIIKDDLENDKIHNKS